ncbi:MAG: hypothetical protein U0T84_08025 [Chitinophagales bacterium]
MEQPNPEQICTECKKQTRIHYRQEGRFFIKGTWRINYLQLGDSSIDRTWLALLAELLYRLYRKLRDRWEAFKKWLFPRPEKLWCHTPDSALVGAIHYADRDQLNVPIHNLRIEFWGRTWWLQWRKLAEGYSREDGTFSLPFELRQARNWQVWSAQFEVYQTTHVYFNGDTPSPSLEVCYQEPVPISNLTGMRYNLRSIHLHLWEYRRDTPLPRAEIKNVLNDAPQYYSQGRMDALYEQIIPLQLLKEKHLLQIADAPETISIASIQNDYPENLTVCIEKKMPGLTRGDYWFGRRMMNGMNRGAFLPDKQNPEHFWIKYFGVCNYDHNQEYALPTVEMKFKLAENGLPWPLEFHLTGPTNAFNKDPWQKRIVTPADGDDWLYVKRIARCNGAFCTEIDEHFTGTHLNAEQYAMAAYRNFRRSPLACLMLPHLKDVILINHSADTTILRDYIPSATAITNKGVLHRCYDLLGMQDWKHWQPMKVISPAHRCAKAEQLFWNVVVDYVDGFIEENAAGIKEHWHEVYRFSRDLVEHAVPVFLSTADWNQMTPQERQLAEDRLEYYAFQYSFDRNAPREKINGELKTVSPITNSSTFEGAAPEDWANLKQACAYAIMMATYMHTWINEHQYDDLGEVLYSSGGLRFGTKERGIFAPESDLSISPDLTRATEMLWFTNFLSRTEYGFITRDEEHDVNPRFRRLLEAQRAAFAELDVDIDHIESRTNI